MYLILLENGQRLLYGVMIINFSVGLWVVFYCVVMARGDARYAYVLVHVLPIHGRCGKRW